MGEATKLTGLWKITFLKSLQNGRGHKVSNMIKCLEVKLVKPTNLSNSKR